MKFALLKTTVLTILTSILFTSPFAQAEWALNMPPGVTEISKDVYDLHMLIMWICAVIGLLVTVVILHAFIRYRHGKGAKSATFHDNLPLEIAWTVVPVFILVAMAIPATKTLSKMYDTSDSDVDIVVTGYQWRWNYKYLNEGISFFSTLSTPEDQINGKENKGENYLLEVDEHMVVPVGKKIRLLATSNDVIHSWWVPDLAVKKDAIPGFINETWTKIDKPGIYRGQCTELCGQRHGFMPIVVEAKSEADYQHWLTQKKNAQAQENNQINKQWTLDELVLKGKVVYEKNCQACHQPGGEGMPGIFPALKGSELLKQDIQKHIDIVLHGRANTSMQAFAKQLNAVELAAVINYERNSWGNTSEQVATPEQIDAMMKNNGEKK